MLTNIVKMETHQVLVIYIYHEIFNSSYYWSMSVKKIKTYAKFEVFWQFFYTLTFQLSTFILYQLYACFYYFRCIFHYCKAFSYLVNHIKPMNLHNKIFLFLRFCKSLAYYPLQSFMAVITIFLHVRCFCVYSYTWNIWHVIVLRSFPS